MLRVLLVLRLVLLLLLVLRRVLAHLILRRALRHHHVWLRRHGLLRVRRVLRVGGLRRLRRHWLVLVLRIVHRLLQVLRRRLRVDASVLFMLRWRGDRRGRIGLRRMVGHGRVGWSRHLCGGHHVGCVCGTTLLSAVEYRDAKKKKNMPPARGGE